MSVWRNILTALWCAILCGEMGFFAWQFGEPVLRSGADLSGLPWQVTTAPAALALGAVFALGAFFFVPLLWGTVIALLVLAGLLASSVAQFGGFGGLVQNGMIHAAAPAAMLVIGSIAFILWDGADRRYRQTGPSSSVKAF